MAAVVRAGQTSMGFWLLSCTFVFQSAAVPGRSFSNSKTSPSPDVSGKQSETPKISNQLKLKPIKLLIIFCFVLFAIKSKGQIISSTDFFSIPSQDIYPYKLLGTEKNNYLSEDSIFERKNNFLLRVDSLNISKQITLLEYKKYLNIIQKDSSKKIFLKALPDSSICTKEKYLLYFNSSKYDSFPVIGISWESAMNYCKWRTLAENKSETLDFIYIIPKCSEWLSAYSYLTNNKIENDFDLDYSDWLLCLKFDGYYSNKIDFAEYDLVSYPLKDDEFNRMRNYVIGQSYFFAKDKLYKYHNYNYMARKGYKHITFRIIKIKVPKSEKANNSIQSLLKFWNLK